MSKPKPKREYVVGYKGDHECVYGPNGLVNENDNMWVCRMTMETAKRRAGRLRSPDVDVQIYRLVPVATGRAVNGEFVERKKAKKKAARRAKADEPRLVKAPDGNWDIRTKTHYWVRVLNKFVRRSAKSDSIGMYTKRTCLNSLPAARAAWKAMKRGKGKQGEMRAAS